MLAIHYGAIFIQFTLPKQGEAHHDARKVSLVLQLAHEVGRCTTHVHTLLPDHCGLLHSESICAVIMVKAMWVCDRPAKQIDNSELMCN